MYNISRIINFLKGNDIMSDNKEIILTTEGKEKLEAENTLLKAKTDALQSQAKMEELYHEAIKAFSQYHGDDDDDDI